MAISKAEIDKINQKFEYQNPQNYLRVILESLSKYNHRSRLDISEVLYREYLLMSDDPKKVDLRKCIFSEIYCKLFQTLEDIAVFALMFTKFKDKPVDYHVNNTASTIYDFYLSAKKGFSEKTLLEIYGLKPLNELVQLKYIDHSEIEDFRKLIDEMFHSPQGEKERWSGLGRVYSESKFNRNYNSNTKKGREQRKFIGTSSDPVKIFQNIKHGYKVFYPTELFKRIWNYDDQNPSMDVVCEYTEFGKLQKKAWKSMSKYSDQKVIKIGTFPVSKDSLEEIYSRIFPYVQLLKILTDIQLGLLDDPLYSVKEFRYMVYRRKGIKEPRHFELCPCGSNKKFKKCHKLKDYGLEGLEPIRKD
jgi:hypothetical protein